VLALEKNNNQDISTPAYQKQANDQAVDSAMQQVSGNYKLSIPSVTEQYSQPSTTDRILDQMEREQRINAIENVKAKTGTGLDPNKVNNFKEWASKNGINDNVLNRNIDKINQQQKDLAESIYIPQIQAEMFKSDGTSDPIKIMQLGDQLKKYSPETAKQYMNQAFKEYESDKSNRQRNEHDMALASIRAANATAGRSGGRSAGSAAASGGTGRAANNTAAAGRTTLSVNDSINLNKTRNEIIANAREEGRDLYPEEQQTVNEINSRLGLDTMNSAEKPVADVNQQMSKIDFSDWDSFNSGMQYAVDKLRTAGVKDDAIFDALNKDLKNLEDEGKLPEGYRQAFAHSLGNGYKTDTDRAIEAEEAKQKAQTAKEEQALNTDMTLYPQKYGKNYGADTKDYLSGSKPVFDFKSWYEEQKKKAGY
jgi:hypothetical protein